MRDRDTRQRDRRHRERHREGSRRAPAPRDWLARLASAVAGGLPALAFPVPGIWPLAYAGLIPLLLLVSGAPTRREAAVRGWLGGAGLIATAQSWLYPKTGAFLAVIALLLGLPWLAWGALARDLLPPRAGQAGWRAAGRAALAAALLAACWVLIEVARSVQSLGGPFGVLGAAPWRVLPLLAPAAVGGVWLVSFLAVATNVGLTATIVPRMAAGGRLAGALVAVVALAAGPVIAALRSEPPVVGTLRAAVVQVGVVGPADQRLDRGERITRTLAGRRDLDLVVWGESSVGTDLQRDPALLGRVEALARSTGAPLLVNVDARQRPIGAGPAGEGIYKRSLLVTGSGIDGSYDKQRLVPFGEYVPLRPALGWLTRLTPAAAEDRRRGTGLAWLPLPGTPWRIGPLVCFESAFPDMSRHLAAGGADLIVIQSSTTSFQRSWAPEQHASLAAVRAVETGRPVLHATLSGTSAAFDARGRPLLWMPTDVVGATEVTIPVTTGTAPYVRLGDWVPVACATALALWAAARVTRTRSRRSRSRRTR